MKKMKFSGKLMAAIWGIIISFMGICLPETTLKVQAAELPVITGLEVAATDEGTGIVARCSYQNYTEQSGCEMRLYLYKIDSSEAVIETQKMLSYAEQGSGNTDPRRVEEGVYCASVTMDFGTELKQVNSQNYYKVTQSGGNYEVTEEVKENENQPPVQEDNDEENDAENGAENDTENGDEKEEEVIKEKVEKIETDASCSHVCEYVIEQEATPVRDAIQVYSCIKCGAILKYEEVPNSAYGAFLKEAADLIRESQPGEVVISTDLWVSFNREVFEVIKSRPDVTVNINYQYQGKAYTLVIQAGIDVEQLMDENGFGGFRYIESVLIMTNL